MTKMESAGYYLYVRQTDTGGRKTVHEYRVWNSVHALSSLASYAADLNKKAREKDEPALAAVESIDEAAYQRERAQ